MWEENNCDALTDRCSNDVAVTRRITVVGECCLLLHLTLWIEDQISDHYEKNIFEWWYKYGVQSCFVLLYLTTWGSLGGTMDRKKFMSKQKTWECTRGSQSSGALIVLLCRTQSRAVRVVVPPTLVQGRTLPLLSPCGTILLWCQRCPGAEGWWWWCWRWWLCCKPRPCHSKLRKSQSGGNYVQGGNQLNRLAHLQCVPAAAGSWTRGHHCLFISNK